MPISREQLRELARCRLSEAKVLADRGCPSGAYYLAGYAIECALKAVMASQFEADQIPDKGLVNSIYTHVLPDLLRLSGLQTELHSATPDLIKDWDIVKNWSENTRYDTCDAATAAALLDAVGGEDRGIFQWLGSRW